MSVIVPAFNAAATIARSIDSVLTQTFQDFEIVVIDDGSSDNTVGIINGFRDQRIHITCYPNGGPALCRNRGIKHARGDFIAFLDADDIWNPTKLANQVRCLEGNQNAGLCYGWADFVDEKNQFLSADNKPRYRGNVYRQLLIQNFIVSGSNVMVRGSVPMAVGMFNKNLAAVEDWEFHTRVAKRFDFECLPQVVVRYRQRPKSLSNRLTVMERSFEQAANAVFANAPPEIVRLRRRSVASFYTYLTTRAFQSNRCHRQTLLGLRYLFRAFHADPQQMLKLVLMRLQHRILKFNHTD